MLASRWKGMQCPCQRISEFMKTRISSQMQIKGNTVPFAADPLHSEHPLRGASAPVWEQNALGFHCKEGMV